MLNVNVSAGEIKSKHPDLFPKCHHKELIRNLCKLHQCVRNASHFARTTKVWTIEDRKKDSVERQSALGALYYVLGGHLRSADSTKFHTRDCEALKWSHDTGCI